jgi:hypothetical protein
MPIAAVFTWRDGLIVHSKIYTDRDAALRDLGVSLDDLEPIARCLGAATSSHRSRFRFSPKRN